MFPLCDFTIAFLHLRKAGAPSLLPVLESKVLLVLGAKEVLGPFSCGNVLAVMFGTIARSAKIRRAFFQC